MEQAVGADLGTASQPPLAGYEDQVKNPIRWRRLVFDALLVIGFLLMSSWLVRS